MLFVDYSAIRRFVVDQKISVTLLFLSVVLNISPNGDITLGSADRMLFHLANIKAAQECKSSNNWRERNYGCRSACGLQKCHGLCTNSGLCLCSFANSYLRCEIDCSNERNFGCEGFCSCNRKGTCNYATGGCFCSDGWRGVDCSQPCTSGYYGNMCEQRCKCKNNATCDHISGECICGAGFQGPYCEEKCPKGNHGFNCVDECKCQNDAICDHVDGSCECRPGWTGTVCAESCPDGLFGMNCSEMCDCSDNSTCNFITGECICDEGFYGAGCDIHCLSEGWGTNRSQKCNYTNEECSYDEETCFPGFHGHNCTKLDCGYNKWGPNCSKDCICKNSGWCHPVTGACCCQPPWSGEDCSINSKEYFSKQTKEKASVGASVIVIAICIPLVMLMLIVVGALFYRKHYVGRKKGEEDAGLIKFLPLRNQ